MSDPAQEAFEGLEDENESLRARVKELEEELIADVYVLLDIRDEDDVEEFVAVFSREESAEAAKTEHFPHLGVFECLTVRRVSIRRALAGEGESGA